MHHWNLSLGARMRRWNCLEVSLQLYQYCPTDITQFAEVSGLLEVRLQLNAELRAEPQQGSAEWISLVLAIFIASYDRIIGMSFVPNIREIYVQYILNHYVLRIKSMDKTAYLAFKSSSIYTKKMPNCNVSRLHVAQRAKKTAALASLLRLWRDPTYVLLHQYICKICSKMHQS